MNIIDTLKAALAALFADNNTKAITEAKLRSGLNQMLDIDNGDNNYDVPASGDTVTVTPVKLNTVVRFKGVIADDFTLNVVGSSDLIPGKSKLILIVGGDITTSGKIVTFTGNIQFTQCGSVNTNTTTVAYTQVFPLIWDGVNFTGIDNC